MSFCPGSGGMYPTGVYFVGVWKDLVPDPAPQPWQYYKYIDQGKYEIEANSLNLTSSPTFEGCTSSPTFKGCTSSLTSSLTSSPTFKCNSNSKLPILTLTLILTLTQPASNIIPWALPLQFPYEHSHKDAIRSHLFGSIQKR